MNILKELWGKVRRVLRRIRRRLRRPMNRDRAHDYWRDTELPKGYLDPEGGLARTRFLHSLLHPYEPLSSTLEVGCNVGRNLEYLRGQGYPNLTGVELNPAAVALLEKHHPRLADEARIVTSPAEDVLPTFKDREFDAVFTMAVLMHIVPESEHVFDHIARVTGRVLVVIENEETDSRDVTRIFSRNYRDVFEGLGFRQVRETRENTGLPAVYGARVFERA